MEKNKRKFNEIGMFVIAIGIMVFTLYSVYIYIYDEPSIIKERADEICFDYNSRPSTSIFRDFTSLDEWHFNCGSFIAAHYSISEEQLNIIQEAKE